MTFTLTIELDDDMHVANDLGRAVSGVGHTLTTRWDGIDFGKLKTAQPCGAARNDKGIAIGRWQVSA